jgi:hypothetical protein
MKENLIFLLLDLGIPAFFFLLGRGGGRALGRRLAKESLILFCAAALFSPIAFSYMGLEVQGALCATLLLLQFIAAFRCTVYCKKKHNILL